MLNNDHSLAKVLILLSTIVIAAAATDSARAQTIRGQVVDSVDQHPLSGTFVFLVDTTGNDVASTIADIEGNFALVCEGYGEYGLRAEMRGYRGSISARFQLQPQQELTVTILLNSETTDPPRQGAAFADPSGPLPSEPEPETAPEAVPAESPVTFGSLTEFNERRERGMGRFITRAEFTESGNPMSVTDVLQRVQGVAVEGSLGRRRVVVTRARGGPRGFGFAKEHAEYCPPLFFRDRRFLGNGDDIDIDALVPIQEVLAIEVHGNTGTLPSTYSRAGSQCGIIAVWTPYAAASSTLVRNETPSNNQGPRDSAPFPRRAWRALGSVWSSTPFQFLAAMGAVVVVFVTVGKGIHF